MQPLFYDWVGPRDDHARADLITSLSAPSATISPRFFYDSLGSALFAAICELPEYYPTRAERSIFARCQREIAQAVGVGSTLIDLGAGDGRKAESLFEALQPAQYVAVDVSVAYLHQAVAQLQQQHPSIQMIGLGTDFADRLELPDTVAKGRRLFFYPGSSIGNFTPGQAVRFLRQLREHLDVGMGGLLIGVDLAKSPERLVPAYDDALGVTAAFNLNALNNINRVLESDFHLADWRHLALFNQQASRIEMHLEARRELTVRWPGGQRRFSRGERIHSENSYKYSPERFAGVLSEAGFEVRQRWLDEEGLFSVWYATPQG